MLNAPAPETTAVAVIEEARVDVAEIAAADTAVVQEAVTERTEIEESARTERTAIEANAAVEIARAQAGDDERWTMMQSQVATMQGQIGEMATAISSLATAQLTPTPLPAEVVEVVNTSAPVVEPIPASDVDESPVVVAPPPRKRVMF